MKKIFPLLLCMLSAICASAQVNNYYVSPSGSDSNDGSQARPWKTIQHADSSLTLGTSGTTIHVMPGTYSPGVFTTHAEGTASRPIIWKSETPLAAVLNPGCWALGNSGSTPGGDYNTIQGFEITCPNADEGISVGINASVGGGNFAKILNNYVHDVGTYGSASSGSCSHDGAIAVQARTHDVTVDSNRVNRAGLYGGCAGGTSDHGIYISGWHNTVTNNLVSNVAGDGLHAYHNACQNVWSNNTVFHNFNGGAQFGAPADGLSPCASLSNDYNSVNNNIFVRNGWGYATSTHGSFAANFYTGNGTHNKAFNNFMAGNFGSGGSSDNTVSTVAGGNAPAQGGNFGQSSVNGIFVNYQDDGSGDYHLADNSPAAAAGVASSPTVCAASPGIPNPCIPTTDLAGFARSVKPAIGALEINTNSSAQLPDSPTNLTATVQ